MIQLTSDADKQTKTYDCVECGRKDCVTTTNDRGYCETIGCLQGDLIQFVFHPSWNHPRASRAGREMWWLT